MVLVTIVVIIAVVGILVLTWALMYAVADWNGEDDSIQEEYLISYSEQKSRRRLDKARRRRERKQKALDFWANLFYPKK